MDDDFFYDEESFNDDVKLSVTEQAELSLMSSIKKLASEMEMNLKLNERDDFEANLEIITGQLDHLISINNLKTEGLSEEELLEKIDEIYKQTTELTLANIDTVLEDLNEDKSTGADSSFCNDESDDGCDW